MNINVRNLTVQKWMPMYGTSILFFGCPMYVKCEPHCTEMNANVLNINVGTSLYRNECQCTKHQCTEANVQNINVRNLTVQKWMPMYRTSMYRTSLYINEHQWTEPHRTEMNANVWIINVPNLTVHNPNPNLAVHKWTSMYGRHHNPEYFFHTQNPFRTQNPYATHVLCASGPCPGL